MTTPFSARDARLSGALDRAFGELFTFTAKQVAASGDVNLPMRDDGTKPPFSVKGVWENYTINEFPKARGSNPDDEALGRSAGYPSTSIASDAFEPFWTPSRGDLCLRNFDNALYEVVRVMPDDMGRSLVILSARMRSA